MMGKLRLEDWQPEDDRACMVNVHTSERISYQQYMRDSRGASKREKRRAKLIHELRDARANNALLAQRVQDLVGILGVPVHGPMLWTDLLEALKQKWKPRLP